MNHNCIKNCLMFGIKTIILSCFCVISASAQPSDKPVFNYVEAAQKSWYFYEAQRSGPLPKFDGDLATQLHNGFLKNRIPWRGDSDLDDGKDVGLDLTGGWHDAGDHVKFGLPMAFSASFMAWNALEYKDAYIKTGQWDHVKDNLRWIADYFMKAHPEPDVLYGQVGDGIIDHSIWGAPEVMPHERPAFKIDISAPGPDLAAETSAALTIISLVFKDEEPLYATEMLRHGKELYEFAEKTRTPVSVDDKSCGKYSDSITAAQGFYTSSSGAQDELPWAAAWLYYATQEPYYLHKVEGDDYNRIADNTGHYSWTATWDDVRYGVYFLMAKISRLPSYKQDTLITDDMRIDGWYDYELHAENYLNYWIDRKIPYTPGGLAFLSDFCSARYPTVVSFLGLVHRKHLIKYDKKPEMQNSYLKFATEQVNYVLGDNPHKLSYMVGFDGSGGDNWFKYAHHRASHGSSTNSTVNPELPRFVLYGALAGGPAKDDSYSVDRNDFPMTEVATDMNAGVTGALIGLYEAWDEINPGSGGTALQNFPPAQPVYNEIYAEAKLHDDKPEQGTVITVKVVNETAYPPGITDKLVFRYFVNLSEVFAAGYTLKDLMVSNYWIEAGDPMTDLKPWKNSKDIFYSDGSFEDVTIAPIGDTQKQKHKQFNLHLSWEIKEGWDGKNDHSFKGLKYNEFTIAENIAIYDTSLSSGKQLVWGNEPGSDDDETDSDNDGVIDAIDQCPDTPANETVDSQGCSDSQKDSDNDGVTDNLDNCPNTPFGETVDANGCSVGNDPDADNDGVKDTIDQCPDTPANETVDPQGCSDSQKDSDNDGVTDNLDNCPNTPAGEIVDANGCPVGVEPGDLKITMTQTNSWPGGAQYKVSLTNTSETEISDFKVVLVTDGSDLNLWNMTISGGGNSKNLILPSWKSSLNAGEVYTFGFTLKSDNEPEISN